MQRDILAIETRADFTIAMKPILPALWRYARRLTQNDAYSDDLVQEALVRAWTARRRFLPGSNFKAWLFRITRNAFLTDMRKSWRSTPYDPDVHERLLVDHANQETGLHLEDLEQALRQIPLRQREALLLVVQDGLTYDEAAFSQRVQPGTVKSRVARARTSIMRYFADGAIGSEHAEAYEDRFDPQVQRRTSYEAWKVTGLRTIG